MHDHSHVLTLNITMHSDSHSCSVACRRVWAALARNLPHQYKIAQSWEGMLWLPLRKCAFLYSECPPLLHCIILRESDCRPRKLHNAVSERATITSLDCALRNSSSQQLDWTAHYIVPTISQSPSSPDYALHSLGTLSPDLSVEIAQPSWSITQTCCKLVLKFILVLNW